MKNRNLQGGFAPLLVIIIILAIGGGAYLVAKNKNSNQKVEDERRGDVQYEDKTQAEADAEANVDLNAKGSLRSLLALGKNTMCTFSSVAGGTSSSGTVYISTDGSMRGDFTSNTSAGTQASSMIVKGETSYVWSGSQGVKMNAKGNSNTSASAQTKSNVDLDSQVDYKCANWSKDESKFAVPASVNFLDIEAMMKGSTLPSGVNWDGTIKGQTQ